MNWRPLGTLLPCPRIMRWSKPLYTFTFITLFKKETKQSEEANVGDINMKKQSCEAVEVGHKWAENEENYF